MVDYTQRESSGFGVGIYLAVGAIILVLLYALFAGGGSGTTTDPAALTAPDAAAVPEAEPVVTPELAPADGSATTVTE